jgi:SAGA-associated factor 11
MSKKSATVTEDELLQRRISHAQWLAGMLQDPASTASLTVTAYADLLDELLQDVAVEAHREHKTGMLVPHGPQQQPQRPQPLPPLPGVKGATDVFGQVHPGTATDIVTCMHCGRKAQAGKFAYHLEKCLAKGRGAAGNARTSRRAGV